MANVTIKDIAAYTNISISTISRVLNNPDAVSPQKRAVVEEAITKLDYTPNYYASNLKSKNSYNIGFIINDIQNPFFTKLISSIERNFTDNRYKMFIGFGLNDGIMIENKINNFLSTSVSGIVFSPNNYNPETEKLLKRQGIYVLQLFTRFYDSFDSIVVDDFYGTYLATRRLLHSNHKNILLIGLQNAAFGPRIEGFKQAYLDYGLSIDDDNVFTITSNEFLTNQIYTRLIKSRPTAIITISDTVGISAVKALRKLSYEIPKDISMIHYDDSTWADLLNITTIGHPIDILGQRISSTLTKGLAGKTGDGVTHKKIDPIIMERNSVADI